MNRWPNRKHMVGRALDFHRPDVIGTQEALHHQVLELREELGQGWEVFSQGRADGAEGGEHCAVFWRTDRFERVDAGTFWLSPTPQVPGSRGWDAHLERIVTWVALKDKEAEEDTLPLYMFNTHFDHGGRRARQESARMLLEATKRICGDAPFVVTGDLNCDETDPVTILTGAQDWPIVDARGASEVAHYGPRESFTGWRGEFSKVIDYVFVRGGGAVAVRRHGIVADTWEDRPLSDHRMVVADIEVVLAS